MYPHKEWRCTAISASDRREAIKYLFWFACGPVDQCGRCNPCRAPCPVSHVDMPGLTTQPPCVSPSSAHSSKDCTPLLLPSAVFSRKDMQGSEMGKAVKAALVAGGEPCYLRGHLKLPSCCALRSQPGG